MLALQAVVSLNPSGFSSGLSSLTQMTRNAAGALSMAFGGVTGEIYAMGRAFGPMGAAVSVMKQSITVGASFEQQMANVASVSGLVGDELGQVSEAARDMAKTTKFTATEAGDALYSLASAGISGADALSNALKPALLLAGATLSDTTIATKTMTVAMANFKIPTEEAMHIADQFAGVIASSPANMTLLAEAMKYAGPAAAGLGVALEKTVAEVAAFHKAGLMGEMAGTSFRNVLLELREEAKKSGSVIGAALGEWNSGTEGITGAVRRLGEQGVSTNLIVDTLGKRAGPALAALMKMGVDEMDKLAAKIEQSADVSKMYEIQMSTLTGKFYQFKSAVADVYQSLFVSLSPALQSVTDKITVLILGFGELVKAMLAGDWDKVKNMIVGAFESAVESVRNFIKSISIELVLPKTFQAISAIVISLSGAFNTAKESAVNLFDKLLDIKWADVLTASIELIDGALSMLLKGVEIMIQGFKNLIVIGESLINSWKSLDSGTKILIQTFVGTFSVLTALETVSTAMILLSSKTIPALITKFVAVKTSMTAFISTTNLALAGAAAFGAGLGLLIRQIPGVADALDNLAVKVGIFTGLVTKQDTSLETNYLHWRKLRMEMEETKKAETEVEPPISETTMALMESVVALRDVGAATTVMNEAMMGLPPVIKEVKSEVDTSSGFWDGYQSSVQKANAELMQEVITMKTFAPASQSMIAVFDDVGESMKKTEEVTKETKYTLSDLWGMLGQFKELKISAFDISGFTTSLRQLQLSLKGIDLPSINLPDFSGFSIPNITSTSVSKFATSLKLLAMSITGIDLSKFKKLDFSDIKIPDITSSKVTSFLNAMTKLKTGLLDINFGELGNIDVEIKGGDAASSGKLDEIIGLLKGAKGIIWA